MKVTISKRVGEFVNGRGHKVKGPFWKIEIQDSNDVVQIPGYKTKAFVSNYVAQALGKCDIEFIKPDHKLDIQKSNPWEYKEVDGKKYRLNSEGTVIQVKVEATALKKEHWRNIRAIPKAPIKKLTNTDIRNLAKKHKIPNWQRKKIPTLIRNLAELKGVLHEPPEVQEYILAGGTITECPPCGDGSLFRHSKSSQVLPRKITKKERKKRTRGETQHRELPKGYISLATICQQEGVSTKVARRLLRGSDIKKPGRAWVWPEKDKAVKAVRKLMEK